MNNFKLHALAKALKTTTNTLSRTSKNLAKYKPTSDLYLVLTEEERLVELKRVLKRIYYSPLNKDTDLEEEEWVLFNLMNPKYELISPGNKVIEITYEREDFYIYKMV